jgi:mannose-6-phosphate isomerase-like protein (cupin superfamily)
LSEDEKRYPSDKEQAMAHKGQVLINPVSGERFTFRATALETDGELLVFDLELTPDGAVPGPHLHPHQEERFEVVAGKMSFLKGGRSVTARAGDTVVVPAGTIHRFKNVGGTKAHVRVEVRPALNMEGLLETAVNLAREGRTNGRGMPRPLDLALFMRAFEAEVKVPFVPGGVARAVMAPLAWVAGYRRLDGHHVRPAPAPRTRTDSRRPPSMPPLWRDEPE